VWHHPGVPHAQFTKKAPLNLNLPPKKLTLFLDDLTKVSTLKVLMTLLTASFYVCCVKSVFGIESFVILGRN